MVEGEGDNQLWGGAIVVCYGGGREGFGGKDVVPLLGAIAGCQFLFIFSSYMQGHQFHADAQENNNEFSFLQTHAVLYIDSTKLVFAIWGLCCYNFLDFEVCHPLSCV